MKIAVKIKQFFHNEGIHSTTIQPEFVVIEVCTLKLFLLFFSFLTLIFYIILLNLLIL